MKIFLYVLLYLYLIASFPIAFLFYAKKVEKEFEESRKELEDEEKENEQN